MEQDRPPFRFLHAADLHLDSRLRGLSSFDDAPVDRLRGATREALDGLVRVAIESDVDFVVIAGDVFDGDWKDFHTGLYFRSRLVRLRDAGIPVFLIRGNHDAQSVISKELPLPEGVTVFDSQDPHTVVIESLGVAVHGQSYARRDVSTDLAANYPPPRPGLFNIGVLHTGLTGREGHENYAPTSLATLCACGYDYFALGHVHTHEVVQERSPRIVFPGNTQGRHARETGAKGCELVHVEDGVIASTEFIELDVVRWHDLLLTLDGIESLDAVGRAFLELARDAIPPDDRLHAIRVRLTGDTPLHRLEARQPGTLRAAVQAAVQDVTHAQLWLEKTILTMRASVQRDDARLRDDALAEVVQEVDRLLADDRALTDWFDRQIDELKSLPDEVGDDDPSRFTIEAIRDALRSAEATVLSSLANAADDR